MMKFPFLFHTILEIVAIRRRHSYAKRPYGATETEDDCFCCLLHEPTSVIVRRAGLKKIRKKNLECRVNTARA
jgi:hypothetical protein